MNHAGDILNLTDYPPLQMSLFAGGCLMWVAAYAIIIYNGRKHKVIEMPVFAVASNFAWEFLWSTFFDTDMGHFLIWTYRAWLVLDIFIFYMILQYGIKNVFTPQIKQHYKQATIGSMLGMMLLYFLFTKGGFDTSIGANSAYIAQLFISGLYVLLILQQKDLTGFSVWVAFLRTIGTGLNTIFMLIHYPENHFLHAMGIISFFLDAIYITLFLRRRTGKFTIVTH
jgi:hypothetical protein